MQPDRWNYLKQDLLKLKGTNRYIHVSTPMDEVVDEYGNKRTVFLWYNKGRTFNPGFNKCKKSHHMFHSDFKSGTDKRNSMRRKYYGK